MELNATQQTNHPLSYYHDKRQYRTMTNILQGDKNTHNSIT